jgi:hypothetical protein
MACRGTALLYFTLLYFTELFWEVWKRIWTVGLCQFMFHFTEGSYIRRPNFHNKKFWKELIRLLSLYKSFILSTWTCIYSAELVAYIHETLLKSGCDMCFKNSETERCESHISQAGWYSASWMTLNEESNTNSGLICHKQREWERRN